MKRFYTAVTVEEAPAGWTVALDGKPIRTPLKVPFAIASRPAIEAAAAEWAAQDEEIKPTEMPVTKAINTAIDHTGPRRAEVVAAVAAYGGADLLCYRADQPIELTRRQAAAWDPLLDWAEARFGARLETQFGLMHKDQPESALGALAAEVDRLAPLALTAFSDLTALSGSLILGLAVADGRLAQAEAWAMSRIDETWQEEQWGADEEATRAAKFKAAEFASAARIFQISDGA